MSARLRVVGQSVPLKDAREKVTGTLRYAVDVTRPGMLHGKILRSPHAHARIVNIDTTEAEALPGVMGVLTSKDVPDKDWMGVWYNYKGHVLDDRVRFVGDEVAAVAALDGETAARAVKLIKVDYAPLPAVLDPEEARKPGAPQVRPEGNAREPVVVTWGDLGAGLAQADIVVEGSLRYASQQYAPVGRNACIAEWTGDRVTVWTSTQTPSECRDILAELLDMPLSKVRVVGLPSSCSFGLWWINNFHLITVLLARKVSRPVKIELDQEECFVGVKRRHLERSWGRLGCKRDGTIVAMDVKHVFDNGAYGYKPDVGFLCCDLWGRAAAARFEVQGVNTNLLTAGCMRGVGDVTVQPFVQRLVDMAAEKLGMDPVEMCRRNHVRQGDPVRKAVNYWALFPEFADPPLVVHSSVALDDCLTGAAAAAGWKEKWRGWGKPYRVDGPRRRAVGMASGIHCSGVSFTGGVSAIVEVHADGSATLRCSIGRQGQGSETTQAQIAAEALGISVDDVHVEGGDTEACPWGHGSVASTAAHRSGFATLQAALDARRQILEIAAERWKLDPGDLDIRDGIVHSKRDARRRISLRDALTLVRRETLSQPVVVGRPAKDMPAHMLARHFAAHFVEVEVDVETGQVRIVNYVAAQDSGTPLNPAILENVVIGGAVLGCGFALSEGLVFSPDTGEILNGNFLDYKVLRSTDFPVNSAVILTQEADPLGPFGAKGAGEAPVGAAVAAVSQAVYNAIGAWLDVPMTPERVLRALRPV